MVLAAGAGTRFASGADAAHKLLAPWRGHPLVWAAAHHASRAALAHTWVVQGAVDLRHAVPEEVEILHNPNWDRGQATSLQTAVRAARARHLNAIVVGLGDQPLVPSTAWRSVANADAPIAVATYDGQRRNPVRLAESIWHLLPSEGDEGARVLMRSRPDLVHEVPCQGEAADIDTREDFLTWT